MSDQTTTPKVRIVYIGKIGETHDYQTVLEDGSLGEVMHFKAGFVKHHGKFAGAMLAVTVNGTSVTFDKVLGTYPDKQQIRTWQALQQSAELAEKVQKEVRTNQFIEGLRPYHAAYHQCKSVAQQRALIASIVETIVRGK